MNHEFLQALNEIEKEKGIPKNILLEAIETSIVTAYKKKFGSKQNISAAVDRTSGQLKVFALKTVVEEVSDSNQEISFMQAKKIDPAYELGDVVEIEVTPANFGRIATTTAKQVVVQRIREAERDIVFSEFRGREGDIITGIVQRYSNQNIMIDLGKAEAILIPTEQMPNDNFSSGDRIKVYIVEVKQTTKGPRILVSRTSPGLIKRLFELEVPEIHDGVVEVKSVAREAGYRSKIAVYSHDPNVDAVGACVGQKGVRVQAVVDEINREKIDIVEWSSDLKEFVSNALSPAKVLRVNINQDQKSANVVVPDYQLSLAIGKEGQNARLAAKLTACRIDIKSETQAAGEGNLLVPPEHNDGNEEDITNGQEGSPS